MTKEEKTRIKEGIQESVDRWFMVLGLDDEDPDFEPRRDGANLLKLELTVDDTCPMLHEKHGFRKST